MCLTGRLAPYRLNVFLPDGLRRAAKSFQRAALHFFAQLTCPDQRASRSFRQPRGGHLELLQLDSVAQESSRFLDSIQVSHDFEHIGRRRARRAGLQHRAAAGARRRVRIRGRFTISRAKLYRKNTSRGSSTNIDSIFWRRVSSGLITSAPQFHAS